METTTSPIPTTSKKRQPTPLIVSSEPAYPQQSKHISLTYNAGALDSLLLTQAAPKHHTAMLEENRRLNIFEAAGKWRGQWKLPAWRRTGNNRWVNRRGNGIPTPNKTRQQRNSGTMEEIFFKWNWRLGTRHWQTFKRHRHILLHKKQGNAGVKKGDLWTHCGGLSPTERRTIPKMPHSGRKFNQLPWKNCNSHGLNAYI